MTKAACWRLPLLLFAGALVMQLAWILALPPFRGIDEFDHAYRAAAVARGQWVAPTSHGVDRTGAVVTVPRSVVSAATSVCASYAYTSRDNCQPIKGLGGGMVQVASAAGRYNPVYYWLVGTPALPFDGAAALYAMRITSAVLCSLFIALAGWCLTRWVTTRWPVIALFVALTPVVIYSTAVVAPNGVEMAAAAALWCALLGLTRPDLDRSRRRQLLWGALPGALTLATVRFLGPLWLALIVLTVLALLGVRRATALTRDHPRAFTTVTAATTVAVGASLWWTISQGAEALRAGAPVPGDPVGPTLSSLPVWLFQAIAAFPTRNESAPVVVYMCCLVVGIIVLLAALRTAATRTRLVLGAILVLSMAIPVAITLHTFHEYGVAWQGRYGMPYSLGLLLVAGLGLEARGFRHRLSGPLLVIGWICLVVANVTSVVHVLLHEALHSPLSGTAEWPIPPVWLVALLMAAGWLVWAYAVRLVPSPPRESDPEAVAPKEPARVTVS